MRIVATCLATALALLSCTEAGSLSGPGTAPPTAATMSQDPTPAYGRAAGVLATGRVTREAGTFRVRYLEVLFERAAMERADGPAFAFVLDGDHSIDGRVLPPGTAMFLEPGRRRHQAATATSRVLFVSVRDASDRTRPLVAGERLVHESADLPRDAMPPGGYDDSLVMVVLPPGADVAPHRHGGIEQGLLLNGRVQIQSEGSPTRVIEAIAADLVLPDRTLSVRNVGSTTARFLVFLARPDGRFP